MNVPFCNLELVYEAHKAELDEAFRMVMTGGHYILGPQTEAFEKEFAAWNDRAHCIGVANGTDAVELALRSTGIRAGDRVATVSHTAVATVAAIERIGAIPVFTDVLEDSFCMDPQSLERVMRRGGIKAVVPVHLYGQCANMDAILPLARQFGAKLVEDCAQAHGATHDGKKAGTFGDAAAFSFYPTKNLGAFGDGGAILANDESVARLARELRQYGWRKRYISDIPGCNSRLDELQAAFLRVRLKHLDSDNARRCQAADRYFSNLSGIPGIVLPNVAKGNGHVWHLFVVRIPRGIRDSVATRLKDLGIGTAIHYPLAVHMQPAYQGRAQMDPQGLQNTEKLCGEILSLPMHAHISDGEIDAVCGGLRAILSSQR